MNTMKCKVLEANSDWDLELATMIVQTNKKVLAIIRIQSKLFEKLINCSIQDRNNAIFNILWNKDTVRLD
jgi:hypothetical protein